MEIDDERLYRFEEGLDPRFPERSAVPVAIVGYGEISAIFQIDGDDEHVFKRLPLFDSRPSPPDALEAVLLRLAGAVSEQLAATPLALQKCPALLEFYFDVLHFLRVFEHLDDDFCFELSRSEGRQSLVLSLRCIDAGRLLGERQRQPHAVVAFSATASPSRWMFSELGFRDTAVYRSLPSPFCADQLRVELETSVDIRYRSRQRTLPQLTNRICRWLRENPGNCIVYFSAYSYMIQALEKIRPLCGARTICVQQRDWREADNVVFYTSDWL